MTEQPVLTDEAEVKGKANVLYVIDVTSSMGPCIDNLKKNLVVISKEVFDELKKMNISEMELSFNAIGFRDLFVDKKWQIVIMDKNFTEDIGKLEAFMSKEEMKPAGGGDPDESALDAMLIGARDLNWDKPARIMIVFTDTGTKSLHPSTVNNNQVDLDESVAIVRQEIVKKNINVLIFAPEGVLAFNKLSERDNIAFLPQGEKSNIHETLNTFSNSEEFRKKIISLVTKTIKGTILDTL